MSTTKQDLKIRNDAEQRTFSKEALEYLKGFSGWQNQDSMSTYLLNAADTFATPVKDMGHKYRGSFGYKAPERPNTNAIWITPLYFFQANYVAYWLLVNPNRLDTELKKLAEKLQTTSGVRDKPAPENFLFVLQTITDFLSGESKHYVNPHSLYKNTSLDDYLSILNAVRNSIPLLLQWAKSDKNEPCEKQAISLHSTLQGLEEAFKEKFKPQPSSTAANVQALTYSAAGTAANNAAVSTADVPGTSAGQSAIVEGTAKPKPLG